jgi:hypothetical protein
MTALAVLIGGVAWLKTTGQPLHYPPGVLISGEPAQTKVTAREIPFVKSGWTLKPLASYAIEARVLGRERYRRDATAALAPWDLALGWGRMSDESVLERLDISQGNRFYHWQYWGQPPLPEKDIISHSANVHVIPADAAIEARIESLRVGALVKLEGWLVEASHPQADRPWRSSLTRDDDGEGACEILYVRSVTEIAAR